MKLGFVSSILDGWSFEEMIDTAAAQGFECVEIACWPSAGKTREGMRGCAILIQRRLMIRRRSTS